MTKDILKFSTTPVPMTDERKRYLEKNIPTIASFLQYYLEVHDNEWDMACTIHTKYLYKEFKTFCEDEGITKKYYKKGFCIFNNKIQWMS